MESLAKRVMVAVGVIRQPQSNELNNKNYRYFVCRRRADQHQGNKWEFPGGKVDNGESIEQALQRELCEEIGINVLSSQPLTTFSFDYPDKKVELYVRLVSEFSGTAYGAEGQDVKWVSFDDLLQLDFPQANKKILTALSDYSL